MRLWAVILAACLLAAHAGFAQSDGDFSGVWKLNPARSNLRSMPVQPEPLLKVEQSASALTVNAATTYPLDGRTVKGRMGSSTTSTATKWEGDALLVNTIVSGPTNYTVMERWTRSGRGSTLTIRRTIVQLSGESESVLVYENPAAPTLAVREPERVMPAPRPVLNVPIEPAAAPAPAPAPDKPEDYLVEAGTRVLLRLTNSVNTKHTSPGDRIYLETAVPVFASGRLVIPRGSYVTGTVTETQRAGRVKGRSSLNVRFDSLTLPNGVTRDLKALPSAADARGNLDRKEGKIEGEGNKGGDARTVGGTTAAGAGIGGLAGAASGHAGMGAGIGAAAGAAAGLAHVLGSRGPDVVLPAGTTMELMLDRDLRFSADELRGGGR